MERSWGYKIDQSLKEPRGSGPWDPGPHTVEDDVRDILASGEALKNVRAFMPDRNGKLEVERFFVRIPDLVTYFYGVPYKYDLFTTTQLLRVTGKKKDPMMEGVMSQLTESGQIPSNLVLLHNAFTLTKDLNQIRLAALNLQDEYDYSMEALTVMHNLAKRGQRFAVVVAHGIAYLSRQGRRLAIQNEYGSQNAADYMVKDFANTREADRKTKRFGITYFSSCNESEYFPLDRYGEVEAVGMPVVTHTSKHTANGEAAKADIFWPHY